MLPKETEQLWNFLKDQPALAGFVLIGGSGLAIRINHRISEDHDLVFLEPKLPRGRIDILLRQAAEAGFPAERSDDPNAVEEFISGGLELHDYQQNFVLNGTVKLSLFVADKSLAKVLHPRLEPVPRVATLPELFKTKALVSAIRSKTRDWLDLYLLMRDHGFTMADFRNTFLEAGDPLQLDSALSRLCGGIPQAADEGYIHLLENPPTLEEMRDFFRQRRNELEIATARAALGSSRAPA